MSYLHLDRESIKESHSKKNFRKKTWKNKTIVKKSQFSELVGKNVMLEMKSWVLDSLDFFSYYNMEAANKVSDNKIIGIKVLKKTDLKKKKQEKSPKSWENEVKS